MKNIRHQRVIMSGGLYLTENNGYTPNIFKARLFRSNVGSTQYNNDYLLGNEQWQHIKIITTIEKVI